MELEHEFVVDDDKKADYCVRKIKEITADRDRLIKLANEEIEEINAKIEGIEKSSADAMAYFHTALYRYFEGLENKKETKTQQSYKLLNGSLVYKKPTLKIKTPDKDDAALLIYLKANEPDMVKVEETPKWGDFKKNLTITEDGEVADVRSGEVLSFLKTEESEASFDVKLA